MARTAAMPAMLSLALIIIASSLTAKAAALHSLSLYGGPTAPTPLVDILRFRAVDIENKWILATAYQRHLTSLTDDLDLLLEGNLAKHFERLRLFSLAAAPILRWHNTPWSKAIGGAASLGMGFSYATRTLDVESEHLDKTSRLLNFLIFELSFPVRGRWESFVRVHHRSGVFGLYSGVVGGSDYLCLGARYSW